MSIASTSAPISAASQASTPLPQPISATQDRKSTRLNSSHSQISYAVFCLKKKKHITPTQCFYIYRASSRPRPASSSLLAPPLLLQHIDLRTALNCDYAVVIQL